MPRYRVHPEKSAPLPAGMRIENPSARIIAAHAGKLKTVAPGVYEVLEACTAPAGSEFTAPAGWLGENVVAEI